MEIPGLKTSDDDDVYLDGQLLVAMPLMSDSRFARSVIYICAHSDDGAMGLIINRQAPEVSFPDLLDQLDITPEGIEFSLPKHVTAKQIHVGGPVETGRGFVLHSGDYFTEDATLPITDGICLTATIDILKAIAADEGPNSSILALGYSGWSPGQLEDEIQANGWLNCPADNELLFSTELDNKYERALAKIGIDPSHLVADSGHA